MNRAIAGIELGGTKCVCVLGTGPDDVTDQISIPTQDPETTLSAIEAVLDTWKEQSEFGAIGLGAFGPIDLDPRSPAYGTVLATPKPGWQGVALRDRFATRYRVPIAIDTDVNGAALAEGRWGAATGLANFAYITVGTGVGAGIVIDGRLVRGPFPVEAGHMRVGRVSGDSWPGACPFHGDCVEGLAAGSAIEARTGLRAAMLEPGDPVWRLVAHALAAMLHNMILTVSPVRLLLGGGVIARQPHLLALIREALDNSLSGYAPIGRDGTALEEFVQSPALGTQAGPLGALAIALAAR